MVIGVLGVHCFTMRNTRNNSSLTSLAVMIFGAALLLFLSGPAGAVTQSAGDEHEVEVVRTDGRVLYKYVDENGDIAFQDRPPPQYFDESPDEEVIETVKAAVPIEMVMRTTPGGRWKRPALILLALVSFFIALYVLVGHRVQRFLGESSLDRKLRHANMPCFDQLQLSDGVRAQVEVDKVVKTPSGILVIGIEKLSGTITGTAEQRDWHRADHSDSDTIANPLARVGFAAQIVQKLVGETPVFERVVYTGNARFSGGQPARVTKLSAFQEGIDHFSIRTVEPDQLDAAWRKLMIFPRGNKEPNRLLGAGWQGWLRRHWRETTGGILMFVSVILVLLAFLLAH